MDDVNKNNNQEKLVFYAIDIVDSTPLKLLRKQDSWGLSINKAYNVIMDSVLQKHDKKNFDFKLWKFIGDEWVFVHKVKDTEDLFNGVVFFHDEIHNIVKKDFRIKSRIWIVLEGEAFKINISGRTSDYELTNQIPQSSKTDSVETSSTENEEEKVVIEVTTENEEEKVVTENEEDWVGHSLDLGFRFGKNIYPYHIALSNEIAYLLLHPESINKYTDKFFFYRAKLEELKGIGYPYLNITIHSNEPSDEKDAIFLNKHKIKFNKIELDENDNKNIENVFKFVQEYVKHNYGEERLGRLIKFVTLNSQMLSNANKT